MNLTRKVLILYASYGEGHRQVSSALEQRLKDQGLQVVTVDLYKVSHPVLNAVTRFFYMKSFSQWGSQLYGWSYYSTRNVGYADEKARILFSFGIHALKKIIEQEKPDAIINTFPFAAMPAMFRHHARKAIRTYSVLTDFALHDLWLHPQIDKYFVATNDLKTAMSNKGIPREKIRVTGIPLRRAFSGGQTATQTMENNGKSAQKTVLIMAGAFGVLQNTRHLCQTLLGIEDARFILVCGRNEKIKNQLTTVFGSCENVQVLGYVEHIADLMASASCVITKAGGITLSEAIAMEVPMIIYRPVPGQERENAAYLAEKGAAIVALQPSEAAEGVRSLLRDELRTQRMKEALLALRPVNATEAVVSEIAADLDKNGAVPVKPITALAQSAEVIRL